MSIGEHHSYSIFFFFGQFSEKNLKANGSRSNYACAFCANKTRWSDSPNSLNIVSYSNQIFVRASIEKILKKDCSFTCGMVIYTGNKLVLCTLNRLFNKRNKRCVLPLFKGGRERPYLSLGWSIALQSHVSNILVSTNKYLNSLTSWNVNTYGEK